jgi:hypothetical protein
VAVAEQLDVDVLAGDEWAQVADRAGAPVDPDLAVVEAVDVDAQVGGLRAPLLEEVLRLRWRRRGAACPGGAGGGSAYVLGARQRRKGKDRECRQDETNPEPANHWRAFCHARWRVRGARVSGAG